MFVTYGIADPISKLFVYIGQTSHFERRKCAHLSVHRERTKPKRSSIKHWLRSIHAAGLEPPFVILDSVQSEAESLANETHWVEVFAALGHPLYNRWKEHREAIEALSAEQGLPELVPKVFKGPRPRKVGTCELNASGTGYRLSLDDVPEGAIIDLLPPKEQS